MVRQTRVVVNDKQGEIQMEQTTKQEEVMGAVRIGNGTKLHRAFIDQQYGLMICCGCPGTNQGSAYYRAKFFPNTQATCKN